MNASISAPNRRWLVWASLALSVVLVAVIGWLVVARGTHSVAAGGSPASASTAGDASGVNILLDLAQTAIKEKRLVAPAGSNAFEFYMSVLQLDPESKAAQDSLHGLFSPASEDVERAINNNDLDEAQRELSLLREFDSTNYTLSLLGGKLDAARQVMIKQDEARAAAMQAANTQNEAAR
jgi:protein TonB